MELVNKVESSAQMEEQSLGRNVAYGTAERAKCMFTDAPHLCKPRVIPCIVSPELRQTYHL